MSALSETKMFLLSSSFAPSSSFAYPFVKSLMERLGKPAHSPPSPLLQPPPPRPPLPTSTSSSSSSSAAAPFAAVEQLLERICCAGKPEDATAAARELQQFLFDFEEEEENEEEEEEEENEEEEEYTFSGRPCVDRLLSPCRHRKDFHIEYWTIVEAAVYCAAWAGNLDALRVVWGDDDAHRHSKTVAIALLGVYNSPLAAADGAADEIVAGMTTFLEEDDGWTLDGVASDLLYGICRASPAVSATDARAARLLRQIFAALDALPQRAFTTEACFDSCRDLICDVHGQVEASELLAALADVRSAVRP
jgi:hypothetical protein